MTSAAMTLNGAGGWGKAIWFPIAAIVIGLGGGFGIGRALRPSPPPDEVAAEAEKPLPKGMRLAAEKAAAEAVRPDPARPVPMAKVHFRTTPPGAQVTIDGKMLGMTPWDGELPESDQPAHVMFWKKGFTAKQETVSLRGDVVLQVDLATAIPQRGPLRGKKPGAGGRARGAKRIGSTTTIDPFN